ncbi:MAG: ABC transporter substrate-binding protein [Planctomycetota bacterium]
MTQRGTDSGLIGMTLSCVPPAAAAMTLLSAATGIAILATQNDHGEDAPNELWLFANRHEALYEPVIADWNSENPDAAIDMSLIGMAGLSRRTMDGFLARVPTAGLIEVETRIVGGLFAGPVESVGFVDLTERLEAEGINELIPTAAYSAWTKEGRIFGLPHDVHPVMLGYRADVFEEAGIDAESLTTWDAFHDAVLPLVKDTDGDGEIDQWPIEFWPNEAHNIEVLILQAGGGLFDASGTPIIDCDANIRVLAELTTWVAGPRRIAAEAREFTAAGDSLFANGFVLSGFAPDWMCNVWKTNIKPLAGKMRLMPLPAWDDGGRRTSVRGGTMLGIARDAPAQDELWAFAKHLYLDEDLARRLYTEGDIITPVSTLWDDPVFDAPDPYFGGQIKGRDYIALIDQIPARVTHPLDKFAIERMMDVLIRLKRDAEESGDFDTESLERQAADLLRQAQLQVESRLVRNRFLTAGSDE